MNIEDYIKQTLSNLDSPKNSSNPLDWQEAEADPHPPAVQATEADLIDSGDEDALLREAMAETLAQYSDAATRFAELQPVGLATVPPAKPRKRRYVGALLDRADVARELAAIYKEAYHGTIRWHELTRATYTLDCLARSMQGEAAKKQPAKKPAS